jgi:hypothetical protein
MIKKLFYKVISIIVKNSIIYSDLESNMNSKDFISLQYNNRVTYSVYIKEATYCSTFSRIY